MARTSLPLDVNTMTLNEYLANHNRDRYLDNVLKKWFAKRDNTNPKKSKDSWDAELKIFFGETEKK